MSDKSTDQLLELVEEAAKAAGLNSLGVLRDVAGRAREELYLCRSGLRRHDTLMRTSVEEWVEGLRQAAPHFWETRAPQEEQPRYRSPYERAIAEQRPHPTKGMSIDEYREWRSQQPGFQRQDSL